MTRIVSGTARGRRLEVPEDGTRPTSDRAREALFNTMAGLLDLHGARVLDLYAGSGALGLEALSRGAEHACLVESARAAARVLARNAAGVDPPSGDRATIVASTVEAFLAAAPPEVPFDVVFADPPYQADPAAVSAVLETVTSPEWLAARGIVVIERSSSSPALEWPARIDALKAKRYGAGTLWYGRAR